MNERGGKLYRTCASTILQDPNYTLADKERANTYDVRFHSLGVKEAERLLLVECAVWLEKAPGLLYGDEIMKRLESLRSEPYKNPPVAK